MTQANTTTNIIPIRQKRQKEQFIEELKKLPIVAVACRQAGISRPSYYRWRKDDAEFAKAVDVAMAEGIEYINDLSEAQLVTLIRERNLTAISLWLKHRHAAYKNRVEVTAMVSRPDEPLSPEQEKAVEEALKRASFVPADTSPVPDYGKDDTHP